MPLPPQREGAPSKRVDGALHRKRGGHDLLNICVRLRRWRRRSLRALWTLRSLRSRRSGHRYDIGRGRRNGDWHDRCCRLALWGGWSVLVATDKKQGCRRQRYQTKGFCFHEFPQNVAFRESTEWSRSRHRKRTKSDFGDGGSMIALERLSRCSTFVVQPRAVARPLQRLSRR